MTNGAGGYTTLDDWIAREAIPFSLDDSGPDFIAAVDKIVEALGDSVKLLGLGEALHGGEELLLLRNRLFQRLAEAHGYSAIAIESSFPQGRLTNEYVLGRGPASYEAVRDSGFSHNFGKFEANRELVEWMRQYNADPAHPVKLHFYGFDSPTDVPVTDSPRQTLQFALDYLRAIDEKTGREYQNRIEPLIGNDADWENPAVIMDPTKAIGQSAEARALRMETEELIAELLERRPELVALSDKASYQEALQFAIEARQLLHYHAALRLELTPTARQAKLLGIRAGIMADNMAYIAAREQGRGKVLVFAHNSHVKRGRTEWQWGSELMVWWPVGAYLAEMFGPAYAVIGTGVGESTANGLDRAEAGTLEDKLTAAPGPGRFIPTHRGQKVRIEELANLPVRSGSAKNRSYTEPLDIRSFTDYDWLAVLDSVGYSQGWLLMEA